MQMYLHQVTSNRALSYQRWLMHHGICGCSGKFTRRRTYTGTFGCSWIRLCLVPAGSAQVKKGHDFASVRAHAMACSNPAELGRTRAP